MLGQDDGERRVRLGTVELTGEAGRVAGLRWQPLDGAVDPYMARQNPKSQAVDFGLIATADGCRIVRKDNAVLLIPLPGSGLARSRFELRWDRLPWKLPGPARLQALSADGRVLQESPVRNGDRDRRPAGGVRVSGERRVRFWILDFGFSIAGAMRPWNSWGTGRLWAGGTAGLMTNLSPASSWDRNLASLASRLSILRRDDDLHSPGPSHHVWGVCLATSIEAADYPARQGAQPFRFFARRGFGDGADDRLGVAGADQQPAAGPVEPQPVEAVGAGVGNSAASALQDRRQLRGGQRRTWS